MGKSEQTGIVQSVDRALMLMEMIAASQEGIRLSDLARAARLPVSTTHRLLTTLERRRYVHQDSSVGRWVIGQRAHLVGESYSLHGNLVVPARRVLRDLRDLTRETANLGVIEAEEAVTIAQAESREIMRAIAPPGGRVPVLNSGMGKAIVATWPDATIATLIDRQGLRPQTSHSLLSREAVFEEITRIRACGYAIDNEEFVIGMRCVAAVVWSPHGEAIAAISASGLAARVTEARVPEIAGHVTRLARSLTEAIGGCAMAPPG